MALHPLVWIAITVALAAAAWTLSWLALAEEHPGWRWLRPLASASPAWQLAGRCLYLAGIPLAALAFRVVPPERMGLQAPQSAGSAVAAGACMSACILLLLYTRQRFQRLLPTGTILSEKDRAMPALGWRTLEILSLELHWAFFRAGMLAVIGPTVGQAVMLALGLVAIESWSNPWRRAGMRELREVHDLTRGAVLALASTASFLLTGSTVLAIGLHLPARLALDRARLQARADRAQRG